ncbi:aminotransferase class III-fold pyridoxal phosphate-dependent enzyme [Pseudolactococcus reticulitermitis]|uniref:Acetylornithine aminotransferase n=1 Tax=Pseudolactococcus reticulitermitis TaxID=2025039 RepID=A0A224XB50_9LACT|nr:aminotransferase class III-fold pyridoxal phosphate-dependent enzyme [Lactococcus reticulitermitis]GAX46883.1 acetylornithine aminotransferase [Lactococcus reticulitermitis]
MDYLIKRNLFDNKIVDADNIYLIDESGNKIIDGCSNSMNVNFGYKVDELEKVIAEQLNSINFMHTGKGITQAAIDLSIELHDMTSHIGDYLVYLTTSGSDCIEASLRIAFLYHKMKGDIRTKVMSFEGSYHGSTLGALSVSGHEKFINMYEEYTTTATFIPTEQEKFQNCYNFNDFSSLILDSMITNPIGSKIIEEDYIEKLLSKSIIGDCVTIFDEIATSMGRLGTSFGFNEKFSPDIICISKGLGVGYANIGAVLVSPRIMNNIEPSQILGHTFNATPVDCSVGLAVLEYLKKNKIYENVNDMGKYMGKYLQSLKKEFPIISKISGKGLMWSIHFSNKISSKRFIDLCFDKGLMLLNNEIGVNNHVTICPPLIINQKQLYEIYTILEDCLKEIHNG